MSVKMIILPAALVLLGSTQIAAANEVGTVGGGLGGAAVGNSMTNHHYYRYGYYAYHPYRHHDYYRGY